MEEEARLNAGIAEALSRQYAEQPQVFLDFLALLLESALPRHVEVNRRRKLLGLDRPVDGLRVELGDYRFVVETARGVPRPQRIHLKQGIVHRTEALSMEDWVFALGVALETHAERHPETAKALRHFLRP
jgi:hypothetical protein